MPKASTAQMHDLTLRAGAWLKDNAPTLHQKHPDVELITPPGLGYIFMISYCDVCSMLTETLLVIFLISCDHDNLALERQDGGG